jgi:epoxyqueuosine reductase
MMTNFRDKAVGSVENREEERIEDAISAEVRRFVRDSQLNRFIDRDEPYFDEPLIGYASADEPLFMDYKRVIGPFHNTPQEIMEASFGKEVRAATVICWILPVTLATRKSNRAETLYPSRAWAHTRNYREQFGSALQRHMVTWLTERGHRALAPTLESGYRVSADTPVGLASTWSERHAAYAAGLGTFGLSDALITPRGIAQYCNSIVTDLIVPATPRPYPHHYYNCLHHRGKPCGVCIARCPAGAISFQGHDKEKCRRQVYETAIAAVAETFGVTRTGCGLCQTKVPCEGQIPAACQVR